MMMHRLALFLCVGVMWSGCSRGGNATGDTAVKFPAGNVRDDLPPILVATPATTATYDVWAALRDELSEDFSVLTVVVNESSSHLDLAKAIEEFKPRCVVLVNNDTLRLFREYARHNKTVPPSIVVMASFLDQSSAGMSEMIGVAYEIPGVTILSSLRQLLDNPVKRVGVLHRAAFGDFVAAQKKIAEPEKVELVGLELDDTPTVRDVQRGLKTLLETEQVDALWVLNDNKLLTRTLLASAWLPSLRLDVPVVVGVENLVSAEHPFGTFAVLPDHRGLGLQVANLVFELADNEWKVEGRVIEQPVSVRRVMNVSTAKRYLHLKPDALERLDRIIESDSE